MNPERNYKDTVFRHIFKNKKYLISLYAALTGRKVTEDEVEIVTLDEVFFSDMRNDLSVKIGDRYVIFIEQQSTLSENMPLRIFLYVARFYQNILNLEFIYRRKGIKIPQPEFFVLYNGKDAKEIPKEMRLSEAFVEKTDAPNLDLLVKLYDINFAKGKELLAKCRELAGYSMFNYKVEEYRAQGIENDESIRMAIAYCKENDYLAEYFKLHEMEVRELADFEWNMETAKKVWREEYMEEGMEKGRADERLISIRNLMSSLSLTAEKAMEALKIPKSDWNKYMSML